MERAMSRAHNCDVISIMRTAGIYCTPFGGSQCKVVGSCTRTRRPFGRPDRCPTVARGHSVGRILKREDGVANKGDVVTTGKAVSTSWQRMRKATRLSSSSVLQCKLCSLNGHRGIATTHLARTSPRLGQPGRGMRAMSVEAASSASEQTTAEDVADSSLGQCFPQFLPEQVAELTEAAAQNMARRIRRLPVQTSISHLPIASSCVSSVPLASSGSILADEADNASALENKTNAASTPENETNAAAGDDLPPIVLLHGFDSSCLEWRRTFPLLEAAGAEVWAVCTLGWGFHGYESEVSSFSAAAKREHLYEFWRQHIGRPAIVVGASLGGAAAIDLAVNHPEAVAGIVLVDAQGFAEGVGPMAAMPKWVAKMGVAVLKSVPLRSYANQLAYSNQQLATEDALRVGRLHCLLPGWDDAMVSFMLSGGYDVGRDKIAKVQQRTLLLWGADDKILEVSMMKNFEETIPCITSVMLDDCGHVPHLEKPEETCSFILNFQKEIASEFKEPHINVQD